MRVEGPSALPGFAADLRELWIRTGKPSYRLISKDVQASAGRFYSKSVIGDVLAGRRAPKQTLLVDLVSSGWRGVDTRLARLERQNGTDAQVETLAQPEPALEHAAAA